MGNMLHFVQDCQQLLASEASAHPASGFDQPEELRSIPPCIEKTTRMAVCVMLFVVEGVNRNQPRLPKYRKQLSLSPPSRYL